MGCVAIWLVIVPKRPSRREVAMLALTVESFLNPGKKAQGLVEEVVRCDLGASTCCMMRTGILIPWTMQVSCTYPLSLHRLLAKERLRRE